MATLLIKILFLLFPILLISCGENKNAEHSIKDSAKTIISEPGPDSVSITSKNEQLGRMFHHSEPFEIISFHRGVALQYTGPDDTTECKNWKINKENLYEIIKNSESINGTTWDLAFAFTTCIVDGQLKQNNQLFDYSVNAGSWFNVTCRDTTLLFGDYNIEDRKFFIESVERR